LIQTINESDIKLNCITLDFCNELAEDEGVEDDGEANQKSDQIGEQLAKVKSDQIGEKDGDETETQAQNKETLLEI